MKDWTLAAALNNARWCDAVCRAHGHAGRFLPHMWVNAAVVPRFLVMEELNDGKLVSPFGPRVTSVPSYYLVYPPANAGMPALQAFRQWLVEEAARPV